MAIARNVARGGLEPKTRRSAARVEESCLFWLGFFCPSLHDGAMKQLYLALVFGIIVSGSAYAKKERCTYHLDTQSVEIGWIAYKTSAKVGVPGLLLKPEISGPLSDSSLKSLLEGLSASFKQLKVDTKNPARDQTLQDYFFAKLGNSKVNGRLANVSEKKKAANLKLDFNGQQHDVKMKLKFDEANGQLEANGEFDLFAFKANAALQSLHEACKSLHIGSDGVSKTWPNVGLQLKAHVAKTCR